jgi:UDP-galactopyranose mutase
VRYQRLAQGAPLLIGGRLGCYQYFDMHQVVGQALAAADRALGVHTIARPAA